MQVYAWFALLEYNGLLNRVLMHLGIVNQPLVMLNTSWSVYLIMFYCYVPFMVMPLYSVLEKLNVQLLEASADLGASSWKTFVTITLPLSMSGIKTGFFLVFVPSFGEFVIPTLAGGGKNMYVGSLISHYFLAMHDKFVGSAFTVVSGLVLIVAVILLHRFFAQYTHVVK